MRSSLATSWFSFARRNCSSTLRSAASSLPWANTGEVPNRRSPTNSKRLVSSSPPELRSDIPQDALHDVRVVVHTERVRHREKQCIRDGNRFVGRKFFDQHIRFRG